MSREAPIRDNVFEDGQDTEFQTPQMEPEDPEPETVSFTNSHKNIMNKMFKMFPHKFDLSSEVTLTAAHKHFNYLASTPKLILDLTLIPGSFLDTPTWDNEAANTGIWPLKTRFPRGTLPYRAGYALKPPGRPIDIVIKDKVLKEFLIAPKISEASLDAAVYHQS